METMGFSKDEVRKALDNQKYNEATATYLLLGKKSSEVHELPQSSPSQQSGISAKINLDQSHLI